MKRDLYLVLVSIHGLIRGRDLELGRDADTGGQTKYVVELARALARQPRVGRVDLVTRRVVDPTVDADYAEPFESLGDGARIVRIDTASGGYIPKERLWDDLDGFADSLVASLREQERLPDLIHSHYADAGYVGSRVANLLGLPLIHTGHSLGRVKRRRLLAAGVDAESIETRYHMSRRIEAEERTLATAARVITSTHQEIEEQYSRYHHYRPEQMLVIPPGTDLERFHPPFGNEWQTPMADEIRRFLHQPQKPVILALSRPDARKNIGALVTAYGESSELQEAANLVIVAGNRDDITDLDEGAQQVLTELILRVDRFDLYGKVAYPKHHSPDEVPLLYRMAAASGGVFVNPALTEPFGLTLIEAAASGLPIVATEDGGPRDIIANCENGLLVDPLDPAAIADGIREVLSDWEQWQLRSVNGLKGVREHYAWEAHAERYLDDVEPIIARTVVVEPVPVEPEATLHHDRALFSDLDQTLLGDPDALAELIERLRAERQRVAFGIATGRRLDSALKMLKRYGIPEPEVLITSGGTEIHYAPKLTEDTAWSRHIDYLWTPHRVRRVLADIPGLEPQPKEEQSRFKLSYFIDPAICDYDAIVERLHREEQSVNVILSFGQFLDVMPLRASKGLALRYYSGVFGVPLERILVAGGSGADEDMIRGNALGVVVANRHHEELSGLEDVDRIYFAEGAYARGLLEAIDHYDFFGRCIAPETSAAER